MGVAGEERPMAWGIRKTEHNGDKNGDKRNTRAWVKRASKKHRRAHDRRLEQER